MSETSSPPRRILIIGWDGGTWQVFRPLAERGLMPRLKSLMARGVFGTMTSTVPPLTPPAWTTLMTGTNPERHGIFGFMEGLLAGETRRDLVAQTQPVSSLSFKQPSLLDILGKAGKRVMCINLPMSYPPRPINGVMITGMLTPADADNFTYPPELKDELEGYTIDIAQAATVREIFDRRQDFDPKTWVRRCTEIAGARAETVRRLGGKHPWDFGFVVFTGADRIFHSLWLQIMTLVDGKSPTTEIELLLRDFFVELDNTLGLLIDAFPDAFVMLTSDHGFGPCADRTVFPDVWLEEKGFLVRKIGGTARGLKRTVRQLARRAMKLFLPDKLTRKLLDKASDRQTQMLQSLDRKRSVAYFSGLDAATYGGVRLARESTAGLDDDARSELVGRIIASLREMRDGETGQPVLAGVYRREEVFPDAVFLVPSGVVLELTDEAFDQGSDLLPDIVLEFREGYTGRTDPLATELLGPAPSDSHVGVHRIEGMFAMAGDMVKADGEVPAMHLADIAPTVLYLSGLPVPANMSGRVPVALFAEEYVRAHPPQTEAPPTPRTPRPDTTKSSYTADQEEQVRERLRHLGYLE